MPVVQCILYSMAYWQRQWQWLIAWSKSDSWVGTRGFLEKSLRDQRIGLLIGLKIPLTSDVRVWGNSSRLTGWTLCLFSRTSLTNVLDHWENCSKELLSSLNLIALVGHSLFPTLEATPGDYRAARWSSLLLGWGQWKPGSFNIAHYHSYFC